MGQFDVFSGSAAPAPQPTAFSAFDSVPTDGGVPGEVEPPPPTTSTFGAAARGFGQAATFGFSDEAGALIGATLNPFSNKSYTTLRDEIRANNKKAQEEHPIAYGAGEVAGAIAPSVVLPGLGSAAEAAGLGGAEVAGRVLAGAAPEGASALKAATYAAGQGGLYGLGSSDADLTKGDVGGALADTAKGALAAGATAGILHKVGQKLATNADDNFLSDVVTETNGKGRPKDQLQARRVILNERDSGPGTVDVPAISSRDVVYSKDLKPILDAAHDDPARAIKLSEPLLDHLNEAKLPAYRTIEQASDGVRVGDVAEHFNDAISKGATQAGEGKTRTVLAAVNDDIKRTWSTTTLGQAQAALKEAEGQVLHQAQKDQIQAVAKALGHEDYEQRITGLDLRKALEKAAGKGEISADARDALDRVPMRFDPSTRVAPTELRKVVTMAQKSAVEALGTIAETEHARLRGAAQHVLDGSMAKYLDEVAAMGDKAATNAVQQIRNINKTQSVVLSMQKGLEAKLAKQQLQKRSIAETVGHGVGDFAKVSGIGDIMQGNVLSGGAKMLAPTALKGVAQGARFSNEVLARTLYQAQRGNPQAQAVLRALRTSPTVAARLAAMASTSNQGPQ